MGVQPEGVEGASGKPPPRLRRGETLCNIKGTTAQFVGSAGDAFSAICFLQKSRFTKNAFAIAPTHLCGIAQNSSLEKKINQNITPQT